MGEKNFFQAWISSVSKQEICTIETTFQWNMFFIYLEAQGRFLAYNVFNIKQDNWAWRPISDKFTTFKNSRQRMKNVEGRIVSFIGIFSNQ